MEEITDKMIDWLNILKRFTEFDYKIISSNDNRLIMLLFVDDKKYKIEVCLA